MKFIDILRNRADVKQTRPLVCTDPPRRHPHFLATAWPCSTGFNVRMGDVEVTSTERRGEESNSMRARRATLVMMNLEDPVRTGADPLRPPHLAHRHPDPHRISMQDPDRMRKALPWRYNYRHG
jgi:hypothetical protein